MLALLIAAETQMFARVHCLLHSACSMWMPNDRMECGAQTNICKHKRRVCTPVAQCSSGYRACAPIRMRIIVQALHVLHVRVRAMKVNRRMCVYSIVYTFIAYAHLWKGSPYTVRTISNASLRVTTESHKFAEFALLLNLETGAYQMGGKRSASKCLITCTCISHSLNRNDTTTTASPTTTSTTSNPDYVTMHIHVRLFQSNCRRPIRNEVALSRRIATNS